MGALIGHSLNGDFGVFFGIVGIIIAIILIRRKFRGNSVDIQGNDALINFMWGKGFYTEIRQLLIEGADINAQDRNGETALMIAGALGDRHIVELLLKKGAKINIRNGERDTALICAARNGHKDIVELLLKKGADINMYNEYGDGALSEAKRIGHKDVENFLIKKGAKLF